MNHMKTMGKCTFRPFSHASQNGRDQNAMLRIPVGSETEWNCGQPARPTRHSTKPRRARASTMVQPDLHAPLDGLGRIATGRTMVGLTSTQRCGSPDRSADESFGDNDEGHLSPIFVCVVKQSRPECA